MKHLWLYKTLYLLTYLKTIPFFCPVQYTETKNVTTQYLTTGSIVQVYFSMVACWQVQFCMVSCVLRFLDFTWKDLQVGFGYPKIVSTSSMMPRIGYIYCLWGEIVLEWRNGAINRIIYGQYILIGLVH